MDYSLSSLQDWDEKICEIAKKHKLDWFQIEYETIDYYEMIGAMAHHGMPSMYNHWSFGKSFERTHQMYNMGQEGLPYELIINSNPSIAYLMRENPLPLQILIMAHCVGHSDFFKNNRMFKDTRPESVIQRFRAAKKRIQSYVEDPTIGIDEVEKVIDACHAVQFQTTKYGLKRRSREEIRDDKLSQLKLARERGEKILISKLEKELETVPMEFDYDILGFISENAKLPSWKKDIIDIIRDEGQYFWPQIQTKIMNEGWACVTGDTLIDTSEGLITAKELVENHKGKVFDGENYQNLTDWHYNPSTERIKITTEHGYVIHGSIRHRILLGNDWKYLTELSIGDELPIFKGNDVWNDEYQKLENPLKEKLSYQQICDSLGVSYSQIVRYKKGKKVRVDYKNIENAISQIQAQKDYSKLFNFKLSGKQIIFPNLLSEELANIIGMMIGDGGFWNRKNSKRLKSSLITGDDELKYLFIKQINNVFGVDCQAKWDKSKWRIDLPSEIITRWLVNTFNFKLGNTAKIKFIPHQIMKSPKSVVKSFLRGLFDTDGCATERGNVIYTTTSSTLASQIQELLLKFGIVSRLSKIQSKNKNHNDCYRIYLGVNDSFIFKNKIGFNLKRKQDRLNNLNAKKYLLKNITTKIISIEKDTGEVYDFTVNNTHKYRSSCFINHNSYNHYKICHELNLPSELHLPIIKSHNQVIRPHVGGINPYHLGFHMFKRIEEKFGYEESLIAREACHDGSFIRQYLDQDLCSELNLFSFSKKKYHGLTIDDVSDDEGWKSVRDELALMVGGGSIPVVYVREVLRNGELIICHEHDGRDLEFDHAKKVLNHIKFLWGNKAKLLARITGNLIAID